MLQDSALLVKGVLWSSDFTQLEYQLVGGLAVGSFTVALSTAVWPLLNAAIGIRVSPKEEIEGLDIGEHNMEAYACFLCREVPRRSQRVCGFAKERCGSGYS
ncbi:MAG TPA: hypothetical protein IGP91_10345 [Thermosynechococcus sp. M46_R2017_013]|nr:hypothetical protein [Thermosynechococcus sp. M46_R2017_013]